MEDAEVLKELYETINRIVRQIMRASSNSGHLTRICIICRRSGRIW